MAPRVVTSFPDGTVLEYDQGAFDKWCVYERTPDGIRVPPRDVDYFLTMSELAGKYGPQRVYDDFVTVYDATAKATTPQAISTVEDVSARYGTDADRVTRVLSILHLGMVSEENKQYTRLGKRVKRLGIHKLLLEGVAAFEAANFMRGMNWRVIDQLCTERGF